MSLSNGQIVTYTMPPGVSESDVEAWYGQNMPMGRNFEGLKWIDTVPPTGGLGPAWIWCYTTPGKELDLSFGQNSDAEGGRSFASIAVEDDSQGDCG